MIPIAFEVTFYLRESNKCNGYITGFLSLRENHGGMERTEKAMEKNIRVVRESKW